ncbi:MAG: hypothetical protein LBH04_09295 [Tannerellaceae bacterium]|jgi:hypothetical protein|nr:hypothetical protein [Tannerellaceae bacterium]
MSRKKYPASIQQHPKNTVCNKLYLKKNKYVSRETKEIKEKVCSSLIFLNFKKKSYLVLNKYSPKDDKNNPKRTYNTRKRRF